jgi:excinuclease UvrABC nuclease subunit
MISIEIRTPSEIDNILPEIPNAPAVFLLWPRDGRPYLARTALLRRRLTRLLGERQKPSRLLSLRQSAARIEYRLTASRLESAVHLYALARRHFPGSYLDFLKLRMPPYVNLLLANPFPRTRITTQLTREGLYYGPFRTRATAERFEAAMLDLFQIRRCLEDLAPSPSHPGCIYGEMAMCLRPCQEVVGADEYRHEVERVAAFLRTNGMSLVESISAARERSSEEMDFEEAARQHKRLEKALETLKARDELVSELDHLNGVAVAPSVIPTAVELFAVRHGWWLRQQRLSLEIEGGKPVSLDRRLRETLEAAEPEASTQRERQESLALLARWYYSSWRDGEWLAWDEQVPYRRLVNAVSRVARRSSQ